MPAPGVRSALLPAIVRRAALILALALVSLTPDAVSAGAPAPGEERITAEALRKQLMFLASPELEGRESTARGGKVAARYLALQLAQAGLKPVGPAHRELDAASPSFYQPFKVLKFRWSAERTALEAKRRAPGESVRSYALGTDFVAEQLIGNLEVTAPLIFAGYGISAPELGYDDYAGVDVRGRIVLVFDHEPQEMRADSRWGGGVLTRHATTEFKARNALRRGAAALLVAPDPLAAHRSLWDLWGDWYSAHATEPSQWLEDDDVTIPVLYVRPRVARDLLASSGRDPADVQKEIDSGLRPRSFAVPDLTLTVRLGLAESGVSTSESILGLVEGSDPKLRDEVVIVCAHHDHDGVVEGRLFPGADDDGSGTVTVLELARALAQAPRRPRRSVLFASWGSEEKGLLGSRYYAMNPLVPLERTAAVVNFDMVGRDETPRDEEERVRFGRRDTRSSVNLLGTAFSPELRGLLERLRGDLDLELEYKFDLDLEENFFTRSDHWSFAIHDLPTLFFSTGLHPDYHTPADTPDRINYEKMERIARLAYRVVWAIADADQRPRFGPVPVPPPVPAEQTR